MADPPAISRRRLLAGLLAAATTLGPGPALAQEEPGADIPRGPLAVPTLLRRRGLQVLRAGIDVEGTATAFRDPFGILDGMAVRVGQLLADGMDVDLALIETNALYGVDELRQGRFDVLLNAPPLMIEVARELLYADPYAHLHLTVVARRSTSVPSVTALVGKRVGVQAGRVSQLVAGRLPFLAPDRLQLLPNLDGMVAAFGRGQVDALVVTSAMADRLVGHGLDLESKFVIAELWVGPACRFGDHDLLRAMNTILYVGRLEGLIPVLHQDFYRYPLPRPPFF